MSLPTCCQKCNKEFTVDQKRMIHTTNRVDGTNLIIQCIHCDYEHVWTYKTDPNAFLEQERIKAKKEIFDIFDQYTCIKDDKWYKELKKKHLSKSHNEVVRDLLTSKPASIG